MRKWHKTTITIEEEKKEELLLQLQGQNITGIWELSPGEIVVYSESPLVLPAGIEKREEKEEEGEWAYKWRESFKPVWVGEKIVVRPPWEKSLNAAIELIIYPAYAFGTGQHPTTYWCLYMIDKYFKRGHSFLDVGSGSGILSILAAKLGGRRIVALDIDPHAGEELKRNLSLNGIEFSTIEFRENGIEEIKEKFDFIVCNIGANFHLGHLETMKNLLPEGGILVLSGGEEKDLALLREKAKGLGLEEMEAKIDSSWVTIVYGKRGR